MMRSSAIAAVTFLLGLATAAWAATVGLRPESFVASPWSWTATQTFDASHTVTGLPNPSGSSDAANKAYVDAQPGAAGPANPAASVGLSTVNGSASTFMRSDAAPSLAQSIAPTWTGQHIWDAARSITSAANAALDDLKVAAETSTLTGTTTVTKLGKVSLYQPTLTDSSSVTVTDAATLYIDNAPLAAGSVTITHPWAIYVGAGNVKFAGTGNSLGTITSGTWNGTRLTSSYVPTDTAYLDVADQTVSGGANVTAQSQTTGNITVDCGARPLQYITNGGAYTITAPASDGNCILLSTNNGSAGAITFSGFSVGSNTGDALDTTNGHKFSIFIWEVNGVAGYRIAAHQ
jgi:hypothetical protein